MVVTSIDRDLSKSLSFAYLAKDQLSMDGHIQPSLDLQRGFSMTQ